MEKSATLRASQVTVKECFQLLKVKVATEFHKSFLQGGEEKGGNGAKGREKGGEKGREGGREGEKELLMWMPGYSRKCSDEEFPASHWVFELCLLDYFITHRNMKFHLSALFSLLCLLVVDNIIKHSSTMGF